MCEFAYPHYLQPFANSYFMKIAIVTPVFPPYRGGIGAVAKAQAECFALSGHEVTVFTPDYGGGGSDKNGQTKYSLVKIKPLFKCGNAAVLPHLPCKLRGFDRVILHYPFFGAAESIMFKRSIAGKLIIFYHMDVFGRGLKGAFFRFHSKYILPLILSRAKKIIVTSMDYARSGAIGKQVATNQEKFVEIPLGADTERFAPRPRDPELAAKLKIAPTDKVILFVGGLDSAHYFKGVDILLHAFERFLKSQIPNYKFQILVVGDGNLRQEYEALSRNLGLEEGVIFAGSASEEDLPKYYNLADLFVLPSIDGSEAFGLVLLEAMASGVPVIASNLPGVRTLVPAGKVTTSFCPMVVNISRASAR